LKGGDTAGKNLLKELQETLIRHGAATITVAEEELVEAGTLDPNQIHIPGIFVQRIFRIKI
jgi:3-oxoacid CoA-transferase subunit A